MEEIGVNEQTPRQIVEELNKYIVGQDEALRGDRSAQPVAQQKAQRCDAGGSDSEKHTDDWLHWCR